jgi:hypothetical protein
MDNATRGIYEAIKKQRGGAYDEIPSPEWLKQHGITEQTFIRRSVARGGKKSKTTLVDLESITPESSVAESLGVPASMIQPKK